MKMKRRDDNKKVCKKEAKKKKRKGEIVNITEPTPDSTSKNQTRDKRQGMMIE